MTLRLSRFAPSLRAGLPLLWVSWLALLTGCAAPQGKTTPAQLEASPQTTPKTIPVAAEEPRPLTDDSYYFPIANGLLPTAPGLLPNALRKYRGGVHEGVDLFTKTHGQAILCGERVLNARKGWVIRADHAWKPLTMREYGSLTTQLKQKPNKGYLDRLRGRQVWLQTSDGAVVRYCHLQDVAPEIQVGLNIAAGFQIGTVGNSGTIDGARGTIANCHLHFEIRPKPGKYLGQGVKPVEARKRYARLFGIQ